MPKVPHPIGAADLQKISEDTKKTQLQTNHAGTFANAETLICQQLSLAVDKGKKLSDLAAVCMDVTEEVCPDELRKACDEQGIKVAVFVVNRFEFARAIDAYQTPDGKRPYAPAAKVIRQKNLGENDVYCMAFSGGMCTTFLQQFYFGERPQDQEATPQ